MKPLALCAGLLAGAFVLPARAAAPDPVQWTLSPQTATVRPGSSAGFFLTATIQPGWHLYSPTTPKGGPNATIIRLSDSPALGQVRVFEPKPISKVDPAFQMVTETYQDSVRFFILADLKSDAPAGATEITAEVKYQSCNDTICLPPKKKTASSSITISPAAAAESSSAPAGYEDAGVRHSAGGAAPPAPAAPASSQGLGRFLLLAFGFGLAAIFTPCVFPMIPITVSFFLNRQSTSRGQGVLHAVIYSLGIVVLFTALGLLTKAIAGPFGVVKLGSSPWVNGFIAAVFVIFGLSLLGAFELTLPSGLLTSVDRASQRGGIAGTLIMGLTFALTSFACVGPIVGPLLVASLQSNGLQPILGMVAFSSGLAAPFFLLALFPSWLKRLPRSGGWMLRVKVVLGFIILAAAIKYLANIDQVLQLGWITRERFLAAWVVLFALPGLYLLGLLRLEGIKADEHLGVGRTLVAAAFLIFSLSLVPGMFGSPLGELDAYVPPPSEAGVASASRGAERQWLKDDYDAALARARAENKLVLVTFTGYACTNCHWMRQNMFRRADIDRLLDNFVLIELYTDGTDAASQRNQEMENRRFSTVAIPYYAILDGNENVVATFPGLTRDPVEFAKFLQSRPALAALR
ncbi:MAG TPA: cytochrome c biogenesis protein CcdA [Bryobacteraceae bacterium]|nr:cytochrome c biogenesis protein CcdA [Bryobacteraceae bacterium]